MNAACQLVIFRLNGLPYGIPLSGVDRVVRAVRVTKLPGAVPPILGIIDVAGRVLPVLSLRTRFGWPDREVELSDQFIIAHTGWRDLVLVVDEVCGVSDNLSHSQESGFDQVKGHEIVKGLIAGVEGLVVICDLEGFLSGEQEGALESVLLRERSDCAD
ncbi:MAG: chemotaxis protein CheW [Verrucomicrobium sp.]